METRLVTYPRLLRRVQAVLIDLVIIPIIFFSFLILCSNFGVERQWIKVLIFIAPIAVLEPIMVSVTGATIGQHITGIRVQSCARGGNVNIILASVRTLIKFIFGWFSLLFVLLTRRHQAIHDFVSRSVVVNKYTGSLPAYEMLPERVIEQEGYMYPSRAKRLLVVSGYILLFISVSSVLNSTLLSVNCLEKNICGPYERFGQLIVDLSLIILVVLILIFGCRARIYGCRRKKLSDEG